MRGNGRSKYYKKDFNMYVENIQRNKVEKVQNKLV